ncbi:unnamed protein product [Linum tenue]|uniref:Uncharacterized protein n=1 Tax=Linum tenue TaxID=586396 RepID=A0AAV0HZ06_9ROSI|nr:unnamed protein product [Linum tenue]
MLIKEVCTKASYSTPSFRTCPWISSSSWAFLSFAQDFKTKANIWLFGFKPATIIDHTDVKFHGQSKGFTQRESPDYMVPDYLIRVFDSLEEGQWDDKITYRLKRLRYDTSIDHYIPVLTVQKIYKGPQSCHNQPALERVFETISTMSANHFDYSSAVYREECRVQFS